MKKLLFLLFMFSFSLVLGQIPKIEAVKINTIAVTADTFLGFDSFGFYYWIKNNVLIKTNSDATFEYKNVSLGKITAVDLQNPLKVVVFFENFNTIVIIDNQFNESQKINFSENSVPIVVSAMGIAAQNQFWIYNSLNQQIGLFDYLKKDYKTISTSFPESIKLYQSDFNAFYWIDKNNNWYACDLFGTITFKQKISDFDSIQILNQTQLLYTKEGHLYFEDIQKKQKTTIEIPEKSFKKCYYKDQILAIFTSEGITNYKIILP